MNPPSHSEPPAQPRILAGAVAPVVKPKIVMQNNSQVMYNKIAVG